MKLSDKIKKHKAELLFVLIVAVCSIPNIVLSVTEQISLAARFTNLLLPVGIYILLCTLSRKTGRVGCWMFILMFFAAFQIVLLYLYGRSVIAVDMFLNLVTTNPEEVGELLGNMMLIVAVVAVIYLPVLGLSINAAIKKWRTPRLFLIGARRISVILILAGAITGLMAACSPKGYDPLTDLYPVNVADNIYLAVDRTLKTARYADSSAHMTYHAQSTHSKEQKEIYVAVVGETSRAPQWQMFGYRRPTTAPLDTVRNIVGFSHAVSESNTTHKSVPMLLSSLDASQFEDSIYCHKSLISAFREAGFITVYISNQAHNHSFIDFFGQEADSTIFVNDNMPIGHHHHDMHLLDMLEEIMASNTAQKQLYVIHTYGSHFSYPDRYPAGSQPFTPDSPVEVKGSNNERLINAYDNTIHYTASLLARLSAILKRSDAVSAFIYTADHGEDIFDDSRRMFLHASPIPSYWQIHVPMLIWLSDAYNEAYPQAMNSALTNCNKRISSSASYFHTLAGIAGLASPYYETGRDLTSPKFKEYPAIYLNDHNQAVALRDCGLEKEDFEAFAKVGIQL